MKNKYWIPIIFSIIMLSSCAVSKPTVKAFEVIKVYDGFFAAKNGKTVLFFAPQDSVYVGKIIHVSIAKR